MSEPVDILENRVLKETPGLLEVLLKDHTTQQNIFWARIVMPSWVTVLGGTIVSL